ncbi:imidazole glycerol phosphate synthase subunit HisH [Alphaproteobacteria bacterium]|jgi:glutamine amidotransferase|nr:imidazole glycerol phosphate synthase subunit HisH [Alphaproteobacteria bacterium]MDB2531388.1 imidazole glycerol phosphate synthase subunit HisH [Alphaproteobacteria bacterium]
MIAIIDSGGANIASVQFALERLGAESVLTKDVKIIQSADKVLLPGVGAAPIAMQNLAEYELIDCIRSLTQPVMGICLGMQLLFAVSPEGNTPLLGIFDADCETFTPSQGRSVPHMGWNRLSKQQDHPLLAGVDEGTHVYFVHSYFAPVTAQTIAATNYGDDFTAIVAENNFMGCQFHPEKSGLVGAQILRNFLEMPS